MSRPIRVFCWIPTDMYSAPFFRDGYAWFRFAYRNADGRHYRTKLLALDALRWAEVGWGEMKTDGSGEC